MQYVIIGNSTAAIGAVEGIRSVDSTGAITIVSDETHHTYSRPLISYLLQGKTDEQRMKYRPNDFYEKNAVSTLLGHRATAIYPDKKAVSLSDGTSLSYDKLLVASGSGPFVPPMDGLDKVKKRFSFMTLDDAKALEKELCPDARVLIVGAGLIGLKCAEGISASVEHITVVDLAPKILSSILDEDAAEMVKAGLEKQNISFILGTSVETFEENTAKLKTGEAIDFDILVTAVGVRPNTALIKDAGGEVNRGIVVDESMKTTVPDVYAAGDCVESFDLSCDTRRILAILPNAYAGGYAAGCDMAGGSAPQRKAIPMNAIGFFGQHIITAGSYTGECYEEKTADTLKKLFYENDLLKGFILVGDVDKAGIYTSLVREKTPLSSIDFDLVCRHPGLVAFGRQYRDEKLGGKVHEN